MQIVFIFFSNNALNFDFLSRIAADKINTTQYATLEKKYKKIQKEMVSFMKAVHFNSNTIEALM